MMFIMNIFIYMHRLSATGNQEVAQLGKERIDPSGLFHESAKAHIHYRLIEHANRPALVLIHPAFADLRIFEPQYDAFGSEYSILAIDMLGHGQSRADGSNATLADMPQLIMEIMARHQIESAHLVGVSMGSLVAQNFAVRFPKYVRSVTVIGGYSIHQDVSESSRAQQREFLKWIPMVLFSMPAFRRYVTRQSVRSELGKRLFSQGAASFTRQSFRYMQGAGQLLLPEEARPPYPLLLVYGDQDNPAVLELARKITVQDPNARFEMVPDAGHCANVDNPKAFNRILGTFISEIDRAST